MEEHNEFAVGSSVQISFSVGERKYRYPAVISGFQSGRLILGLKYNPPHIKSITVGSFAMITLEGETYSTVKKGSIDGVKEGFLAFMPQEEVGDAKNRSFIRAEGEFLFKYAVLNEAEYQARKASFASRIADMKATEHAQTAAFRSRILSEKIEKDPELQGIVDMIAALDKKVDTLMEIMKGGKVAAAGSGGAVPTFMDISGSGMRFRSSKDLTGSPYIDIELTLPLLPPKVIPAICKVVKIEELPPSGNLMQYDVAAQYLEISEADREEIVKYTFRKQRELTRIKNKLA